MKIRTKLLLALGAISLLPLAAAYLSVISNPHISFALRMNEYEAQQGMTAQRLHSTLQAIVAAVEESLSETYRIQAQPGEREDAERQREFANAALQSDVGSYSADLDALIASQKQEVQESAAAGAATGVDTNARETELLKHLADSLPTVKSNAEKFIQLSDAASHGEGDFVQTVLEPEVRDGLNKTAQDLVDATDRGAGEYRQNIDVVVKNSYKQSLFIVFLGLIASALLAAGLSHTVIAPIQQLGDAVQQFGQGKMDTRIPRHSRDEIGELAVSFNLMADDLTKFMRERGQAQDDLCKAHEKLKAYMEELESRNREGRALSEMANLLQSCLTLEETSTVIGSTAQKLFPGFSGAALMFSASGNLLEAVTTWGRSSPTAAVVAPNECWALRRGHLHYSETRDGALRCNHFGDESRLSSLCMPLMAQGETLGILCLTAEAQEACGAPKLIPESVATLALSLAEQTALCFANLRLREKLRYQSIRDPLTGLFNRRFLDESLEREVARAVRKNRAVAVIMLDVDRFKRFNDVFGHDAGDTVLRELGDYIAKFIRRGDLACRYGGEEFTLILPECSLEEARRRAEELRTTFQRISIKHGEAKLGKVTLSLGVATLPEHGTTGAELLAAADAALLRAKQEGRDRVLVAEVPAARY